VDYVLVNGKVAYRCGDVEPSRNGRFLARESMPATNSNP
jgi:hypothetical protein